jgi:hypothetical protein
MGKYEDRQRAQEARAGKKRKGRQFLQLFTNVKRSTAYHGLSPKARSVLFEIIDRYNGINNGMIGLGVREVAYELGIGHSSAGRAMQELDDAGLARPMKPGAWRGKRATEWRKPLSQSQTGNTKVPLQEHREVLSPKLGTQTRNSSMNGNSLSPITEAHIDIYQGLGGGAELTEVGTEVVVSLLKTESNQQAQNNVALSAIPKNLRSRRKP